MARAHVPVVWFAGPDEDWCAVINGTEGSDIVMLYGGVYTGPCDIVAKLSDTPGEITTVQSLDPLDPAIFAGSSADYVLHLGGEAIILLELEFRELAADIDAVRIGGIREAQIRSAWFRDLAGVAVIQQGDADVLQVSDTEFVGVARPVVLGCQGACGAGRIEVSENLVVGGSEALAIASAGGLVIDNVVSGAAAGLRIEGSGGGPEVSGNLIETGGAALTASGAALLRANVAIGDPAIAADGRVRILGNTLVATGPLALRLDGGGGRVLGNAILGGLPDLAGVEAEGNVSCTGDCFVDAAGWDFFPAPGSPLREAGAPDPELGRDWCGRVRAEPPSAGAIEAFGEASFGALRPAFKDDIDCALPGATGTPDPTAPTGTTDPPPGTDEPADPAEPAPEKLGRTGCGCGSRPGAAGSSGEVVPGALVALGLSTRRRARRRR